MWKLNLKSPLDLFIQALNIFHSAPFHVGSLHIIRFYDHDQLLQRAYWAADPILDIQLKH